MSISENLTLGNRLVVPAPALDAEPGFHLVIYEQSGRGRKFLRVLEPGKLFERSWFRSESRYTAFRVSAEPRRRHVVRRPCKTNDQLDEFILQYTIVYQVDDPQAVVDLRDRDPLRRLEEWAEKLIFDYVRALKWIEIWHGHLGDEEWRPGSRAVSILNEQCRHFGIRVLELEVSRELLGSSVNPTDKVTIEEGRDQRREYAEHQLALQRQVHQTELQVGGGLQTAIQVIEEMTTRAGASVHSFPEMRRALQQLHGIRDELSHLAMPALRTRGVLEASTASPDQQRFLGPSTVPETGEWKLLEELRRNFENTEPEVRHRVVAGALRRIAFVLYAPEDRGDLEDSTRRELEELQKDLHDRLSESQIGLLRRLIDISGLREVLEGGSYVH